MVKRYPRKFYETPTDAISRKMFDRYKDQQVRRHVRLAEEVKALRRALSALVRTGEEE